MAAPAFFDAEEIAMKFLSRRTCPKNARTDIIKSYFRWRVKIRSGAGAER